MDRELGGFDFNTLGDHCDTPPPVIEKWFKVDFTGGMEFHGFESTEVIEILTTLGSMAPTTDSVRYRPE